MKNKPPMIRPVSWLAVLMQLVVIGGFAAAVAFVFRVRDPVVAIFFGALAQAILSRISRAHFCRDHRRGIRLIRGEKWTEAARCFEAGHAAFSRRPWVDRWRWLTLGSSSAMSYREMALCNAAFCHAQAGDGARAMALYEQALREFPESGLAKTSLTMLRSVQAPPATTGSGD